MGMTGSHFLMAEDNGEAVEANGVAKKSPAANRKPSVALQNPPKCDIINPKNKFCLPCNRVSLS
jgi:hypothetical protein